MAHDLERTKARALKLVLRRAIRLERDVAEAEAEFGRRTWGLATAEEITEVRDNLLWQLLTPDPLRPPQE